jgi:predicted  nucleic acid-binding Zn-ribbon protein
VHQDLLALLALQADDDVLSELEARVAAFGPKLGEMDRALRTVMAEQSKAVAALEAGERDERELQGRLESHRILHERNVSQLDAVRKQREAAAALTAAEITRRVVQDLEREIQQAVARVVDLRARVKEWEQRRAEIEATQADAREEVKKELAAIEKELTAAREKRSAAAAEVPRPLLSKYDKLRTRRKDTSVFAISGSSCGNCDMAVPIQRRNMMVSTKSIEVCEACGVLLYIAD